MKNRIIHKRRQQANKAITHPVQGNIADITNISQLRQQDCQTFLDYHKSPAALHDNFKSQTGIQKSDMIPIKGFMKTVKRPQLVDGESKEENIENWVQPAVRKT